MPFSRINILTVMILLLASNARAKQPETVKIPAGTLKLFWQVAAASKNMENDTRRMKVSSFEAMKYPVTVLQYKSFLAEYEKWSKDKVAKIFADKTYLNNLLKAAANEPVTSVSWFAARAFCESHNMRLPTLFEWEYMAAASETKADANSDEKFLRRILDWYGKPQGKNLDPVGSIYKNVYGVWDLHGLTWEWVDDFNSIFVTGESREDSTFNKDMFCGSGGLNGANKEDYAAFMRFAFRSSLKGNSSVWNLGFRCVRSL